MLCLNVNDWTLTKCINYDTIICDRYTTYPDTLRSIRFRVYLHEYRQSSVHGHKHIHVHSIYRWFIKKCLWTKWNCKHFKEKSNPIKQQHTQTHKWTIYYRNSRLTQSLTLYKCIHAWVYKLNCYYIVLVQIYRKCGKQKFDDIYKTHLLIEGIFFEGLTILNNTLTHVFLCLHLTHILYKVEQFLSYL